MATMINNTKGMRVQETVLVILSDMHSGSSKALFPIKGFVNSEKNLVLPNDLQREIYSVFVRFSGEVAKARKGKRLILVNLGDGIDGNPKGSQQESLYKTADQCNAHVWLMQDFMQRVGFSRKTDAFYYVRGTEIHVQETENNMAKELGAIPVDAKADDVSYVHEILELPINGALHVFAHHGKARGSGQNEGNSLRNYLRDIRADRKKDGLPVIDALWSGHTHAATWVTHIERMQGCTFHQMHGVICPSWQAKTRHALYKVPMAVNSVGGVYVNIGVDGVMGVPHFVVQTTRD